MMHDRNASQDLRDEVREPARLVRGRDEEEIAGGVDQGGEGRIVTRAETRAAPPLLVRAASEASMDSFSFSPVPRTTKAALASGLLRASSGHGRGRRFPSARSDGRQRRTAGPRGAGQRGPEPCHQSLPALPLPLEVARSTDRIRTGCPALSGARGSQGAGSMPLVMPARGMPRSRRALPSPPLSSSSLFREQLLRVLLGHGDQARIRRRQGGKDRRFRSGAPCGAPSRASPVRSAAKCRIPYFLVVALARRCGWSPRAADAAQRPREPRDPPAGAREEKRCVRHGSGRRPGTSPSASADSSAARWRIRLSWWKSQCPVPFFRQWFSASSCGGVRVHVAQG